MNTVLDFLALRPAFTAWGLRLLWWAFLLQIALDLIGIGSVLYQSLTLSMVLLYLPNLLGIIVKIGLVRVLFEVALLVIQRRNKDESV